jgi:hypothetical protein
MKRRTIWNKSFGSMKSRQRKQNIEQRTAKTVFVIIGEFVFI